MNFGAKYYHATESSHKCVIPYLYTSFLYHFDYLEANLPRQHPIFTSRAVAGNEHFLLLRQNIVLRIGVSEHNSMKATGIPQHIATAVKVVELEKK